MHALVRSFTPFSYLPLTGFHNTSAEAFGSVSLEANVFSLTVCISGVLSCICFCLPVNFQIMIDDGYV